MNGDRRHGGEYRPRNGSISTRSRLKPRLGAAAEAAVRRQFTDRAEPRVYSRLFGARNRSLLPAPHAHVVISRERPRTNGDRRHGGEYRPRNGSIWTRS